jgi:two-component system phosphate regulon response regulator OmpR
MREQYEEVVSIRPCVVLGCSDGGPGARTARGFRLLGWDVYHARSGPEARRLARMLEADLVVLDADLPEESGWLTCAKLRQEGPVRVLLLTESVGPRQQALAYFVGAAAVIERSSCPEALLQRLEEAPVPAAG